MCCSLEPKNIGTLRLPFPISISISLSLSHYRSRNSMITWDHLLVMNLSQWCNMKNCINIRNLLYSPKQYADKWHGCGLTMIAFNPMPGCYFSFVFFLVHCLSVQKRTLKGRKKKHNLPLCPKVNAVVIAAVTMVTLFF